MNGLDEGLEGLPGGCHGLLDALVGLGEGDEAGLELGGGQIDPLGQHLVEVPAETLCVRCLGRAQQWIDRAALLKYTDDTLREGSSEMDRSVKLHMTRKGLLIPRKALGDLGMEELEAVREEGTIVIRSRSAGSDERTRVRQALREAGMLYEPEWETPTSVSPEECACLAEKLGEADPLSEVIIADRGDRA